jgi:hypothetical protein
LTTTSAHSRKKAEEAEFKAAVAAALEERDAEGRALIAAYNKVHKHVMRSGSDNPAVTEEQVRAGQFSGCAQVYHIVNFGYHMPLHSRLLVATCAYCADVCVMQQMSPAKVQLQFAAELLAGVVYCHTHCHVDGRACAVPQLVSAKEASNASQLLTGIVCCHMRWCADRHVCPATGLLRCCLPR